MPPQQQRPLQLDIFGNAQQPQGKGPTVVERFNDYAAFTDKFKPKKTTDDCYTPPEVYDAVLSWLRSVADIEGREIVRPFYPGGDYKNYAYPDRCVVVDNPPFSIYAQIVRWYLARGIDFLLFAPALTQFVQRADVCYVIANANVTYENGAVVRTNFTTTLLPGWRVATAPELYESIDLVCERLKGKKKLTRYLWPANVVTSALLAKLARVPLRIAAADCEYVHNLDCAKAISKGLFGGGMLISDRAAADRAAADRAAANAYAAVDKLLSRGKAAAAVIPLSDRERAIVDRLNAATETITK